MTLKRKFQQKQGKLNALKRKKGNLKLSIKQLKYYGFSLVWSPILFQDTSSMQIKAKFSNSNGLDIEQK